MAGLDVAEALGTFIRGDKSIPIHCAVLDIQGKDGQMGVQTLVFDTADTVVFGEGKIDLRDEKLNVVMTPVPKDFSPFSLRSYIRATGPFNNVSIFPDPLKTGTDSFLKKAFNVLVMLASSVIQPRDLWFGRDVDCDALITALENKDPQRLVLKDMDKTAASNGAAGNRPLPTAKREREAKSSRLG